MIDLIEHVFIPVCRRLSIANPAMYSLPAIVLMSATAATESRGGRAIRQDNNGPARGIFQEEPIRYDDIENYLDKHLDLGMIVRDTRLINGPQGINQLQGNLYLAAAHCRVGYFMCAEPLPDIKKDAVWEYYKRWWNSYAGAATREKFFTDWELYMPQMDKIARLVSAGSHLV